MVMQIKHLVCVCVWVASLQWIFLKTCVLFAPLIWTETYTAPCEYSLAPAPYSVLRAPCCVPNILIPSVRKRARNLTRVIGPQSSELHWAQKNMAVAATYSINVLITFCCCFRPLLGDDIDKGLFVRLLFFWNWPIVLENKAFKHRWVWHMCRKVNNRSLSPY